MKALRIVRAVGLEGLELQELPDPVPAPAQLLVRVRASGLNRADLLQARGLYPAPPGSPPDILGLEFAGEVVAVGSSVQRHRVGDKVMGIVGGGAHAQLLVIEESEALLVPQGMPFEQAAALPEAFLTAFDALVLQGGLAQGEHVLIHAVGSGVGTAAVQLVHALGATPIGTARTPQKLEQIRQLLGLRHGIACPEGPRFADQVLELTGRKGAELALDLAGGDYLPQTVRAMAVQGRILLVGLLAGARAQLDLGLLLSKRLRLTGTVLRSRPGHEKAALAEAARAQLLPLFAQGRLRPLLDSSHPAEQARPALERLQANLTLGKVTLTWP
jgi:NADPH:quinone reductase